MMDVRSYQPQDREQCLAVFDTNTPSFFHPSERAEFAGFLDKAQGDYLVLDHEGQIVGCGGTAIENADLASVTWLMVRGDLHGNGLGRLLVFTAMRRLSKGADPTMVRLHTSPQAAEFFVKLGFRETGRVPNGIAPGLDRVEMVKKLKVCP